MKKETVYTLEDVTDAINGLNDAITYQPTNDFNQTIGDELHSIDFHLSRIADALEKIANK